MAQRSSMQSTKYIEQGKGQGSRKAEQATIANSSVVYTTATMPYITSIVSSSVFMLYIPTPDDTQLAEHTIQWEIWRE